MKERLMILALKGLQVMLTLITPELKAYIKKNIEDWKAKAIVTTNPFDDILIGLIESLFV